MLSNGLQASLFGLMGGLELTDTSELVGHLVLHLVDVLGVHFHLLVHAALQVSDLVKVGASCLNLNLKLGSGRLSLAQLALLEVQIFAHFLDLAHTGQGCLPMQVLGHVLKKGDNGLLSVSHVSLEHLLLLLVLLSKIVDLLFLLVENLELLFSTHATGVLGLVA